MYSGYFILGSCIWTCPTDLWGCDCNTLYRGEGDYKWQAAPHYQSRSRGAQESGNWHGDTTAEHNAETKTQRRQCEFKNFRCSLLLSVCLIRLHSEYVVAMGTVLAEETQVICDALWLAVAATNKAAKNLELPNCQSAWLDVTLCFPSRVFVAVIYFISYISPTH